MPKPILFGFQTVRVSSTPDEVAQGRRMLADFAETEGYCLDLFVERDVNRPGSAFSALISRARETGVAAVAVPTPADLGLLPRVQHLMRRRLEHEAGVPVIIVKRWQTPAQDQS